MIGSNHRRPVPGSHLLKQPQPESIISLEDLDLFKQRSFWGGKRQRYSFYCPQCRSQRSIPMHPRPGQFQTVMRVILSTAFFTLLTWPWFGLKGVVWFIPLWAGFEVFYRTRVRGALSCPHCGFDPYLYLNDVNTARVEMERFWKSKLAEQGLNYPSLNHRGKRVLDPVKDKRPPETVEPPDAQEKTSS